MKDEKKKGQGSFANMPQEVQMKPYPKYPRPVDTDLDDSITGIDSTCSRSASKRKSYVSNQK